jgi:hypothetical protein
MEITLIVVFFMMSMLFGSYYHVSIWRAQNALNDMSESERQRLKLQAESNRLTREMLAESRRAKPSAAPQDPADDSN